MIQHWYLLFTACQRWECVIFYLQHVSGGNVSSFIYSMSAVGICRLLFTACQRWECVIFYLQHVSGGNLSHS